MSDVQLTCLSTSCFGGRDLMCQNFFPVLLYSFKFNLVPYDAATPREVSCVKMHCNSNVCSSV